MPEISRRSFTIVLTATWIHNIFFVLFILAFLAHFAAIILKPNRPMVRGILTGTVCLDYARHRHTLWLDDMEKVEAASATAEQIHLPEIPAATEEMAISKTVEIKKEAANKDITNES